MYPKRIDLVCGESIASMETSSRIPKELLEYLPKNYEAMDKAERMDFFGSLYAEKVPLRIQKITDRPVTRGIDKMINECFDKLEKRNCNEKSDGESESE